MEYKKAEQTAMLVLLFNIMEFGIVGGYLSKLCVTLPHMSIGRGVIAAATFHEVHSTPHAQAAAQGDGQSLQNVDSISKKAHIHISFRSVELSG